MALVSVYRRFDTRSFFLTAMSCAAFSEALDVISSRWCASFIPEIAREGNFLAANQSGTFNLFRGILMKVIWWSMLLVPVSALTKRLTGSWLFASIPFWFEVYWILPVAVQNFMLLAAGILIKLGH